MAGARSASRRRYVLLLIVLTAVTLITLDTRSGRTGPLGAVGRAAHSVVSPAERAVDAVARPVGDWWDGIVDAGKLRRRNRDLRDEVARLRQLQLDAEQAVAENETLHKLLDLPLLRDIARRTARIVGREPGNFDSTLTIDKGTEAGIAVDMPVVAPEGLVGKVIEAWRGGAKIRVLTDAVFAVGVQAPPHPPAVASTGSARGQVGTHELIVDDFDAQSTVAVGDRIVTSPISTDIPPDLRVGTVTRVDERPGGQGMRVHIKPAVDLGALQYVVVLLWVHGQGPVLSTTSTTSTTVGNTGP